MLEIVSLICNRCIRIQWSAALQSLKRIVCFAGLVPNADLFRGNAMG